MKLEEHIKNSKSLSPLVRMIKNHDDLYQELIEMTMYLDSKSLIITRLYHIKNNLIEVPKCPICLKNRKWSTKYSNYCKTCGERFCVLENKKNNVDPEKEKQRRQKISNTQKNFTDEQKEDILNKMKKTNMERYGEDSFAKTNQFKSFMLENYGYISPFELKETHEKSKKALIERTGYDHNFKIPEVKEKRKQTFLNKYGVNTPTKNEDIKEKSKETNLNKYGEVTFSKTKEYTEKVKQTNQERYNEDSYTQTNEYKERYKKTCLDKYGCEHWMQNEDNYEHFIERSKGSSYKDYILPSGKIVKLQGYEDYVIENLLKTFKEDDIIVGVKEISKRVGKLYYTTDKTHRYYPDIFIKSINTVIEVKSDYTINENVEINNLKKESCLSNNLNFDYFVVCKKDYRKWKNKKL